LAKIEQCEICGKEVKLGWKHRLGERELIKWWGKRWCKECFGKSYLIVAKKYWDKCPLCGSEIDFEAKGIAKNYLMCRNCSAEWAVVDKFRREPEDIILHKPSADGTGASLKDLKRPFDWWMKTDLAVKLAEEAQLAKKAPLASASVEYLGGHFQYPKKTLGTLVVYNDRVKFKQKYLESEGFSIPIEQIQEVGLVRESQWHAVRGILTLGVLAKESKRYLSLRFVDKDKGLEGRPLFDFPLDVGDGRKTRISQAITEARETLVKEEKVPSKEVPEEDPLKILKLRLAKGEITKKEYEKMKKALET